MSRRKTLSHRYSERLHSLSRPSRRNRTRSIGSGRVEPNRRVRIRRGEEEEEETNFGETRKSCRIAIERHRLIGENGHEEGSIGRKGETVDVSSPVLVSSFFPENDRWTGVNDSIDQNRCALERNDVEMILTLIDR